MDCADRPPHSLPESVLAGPEQPGRILVDDGDRNRALSIIAAERPAREQRDTNGVEVVFVSKERQSARLVLGCILAAFGHERAVWMLRGWCTECD